MNFIHEQDGLLLVQLAALCGSIKHLSQLGFPRQDGGEGIEVRFGQVGDDHSQGSLARTGWTPQDDGGKKAVGFDGAAQELARTQDIFLTDEFLQGARAHTGCQGSFIAHTLLMGVGEEIHGGNYTRVGIVSGRSRNQKSSGVYDIAHKEYYCIARGKHSHCCVAKYAP